MSDQDLATLRVSLEMSRHRNVRLMERLAEQEQDIRDLRAQVKLLEAQLRDCQREVDS